MSQSRTIHSLVVVAVLLVTACAKPARYSFMHERHREVYSIQSAELENLQFYMSTRVLVKDVTTREISQEAASVILVPEGTPGLVNEVGPNWLRVSFEEGGSGVYFLADVTSQRDDAYWLATKVKGLDGLHKLKDLEKKILLVEGTPYDVIYGAEARLMVSAKDLWKVVESRRHIKGREKKSD